MAPARPVHGLRCDDRFRAAAGKIIWTRFDEMMSFRDAALAEEGSEGVHDMRVASRRLRASLEVFRDVFPGAEFRPFLATVKQIADDLGAVRDRDVMLIRLGADLAGRPPAQRIALRQLMGELIEQRASARKHLQKTLSVLDREQFARSFLAFVAKETM